MCAWPWVALRLRPFASRDWNSVMAHKTLPDGFEAALAAAMLEIAPKGDWLGSAEYRKEMAQVLVRRVMGDVSSGG